jgi:hypothetical protein
LQAVHGAEEQLPLEQGKQIKQKIHTSSGKERGGISLPLYVDGAQLNPKASA